MGQTIRRLSLLQVRLSAQLCSSSSHWSSSLASSSSSSPSSSSHLSRAGTEFQLCFTGRQRFHREGSRVLSPCWYKDDDDDDDDDDHKEEDKDSHVCFRISRQPWRSWRVDLLSNSLTALTWCLTFYKESHGLGLMIMMMILMMMMMMRHMAQVCFNNHTSRSSCVKFSFILHMFIYEPGCIPVTREEIVFIDHNETNGTINALRLGMCSQFHHCYHIYQPRHHLHHHHHPTRTENIMSVFTFIVKIIKILQVHIKLTGWLRGTWCLTARISHVLMCNEGHHDDWIGVPRVVVWWLTMMLLLLIQTQPTTVVQCGGRPPRAVQAYKSHLFRLWWGHYPHHPHPPPQHH